MKKRSEMVPGKRYRGYGYINEFREFMFEPEDTGSREGVIRRICSKDGVSVSETRNNILVHFKVQKRQTRPELVIELTRMFNCLLNIMRDYEI